MIKQMNGVIIYRLWPEFVKLLDGTQKKLLVQYEEDDDKYDLFAVDSSIIYTTEIYKESKDKIVSGNDKYRVDFESNWLKIANQQISI